MQNKTSNTFQAFWVGMGSLSSFALAIVSAAILSRYFDKAEYGTYKQIVHVYSTLLTLFAVGLPSTYAYFLPKLSLNEGKDLLRKLTILFIALGVIFSIFLFSFSGIIADLLKNPELKKGLKLFSPIPLLLFPTLGIEGIYTSIRKTYVIAIYTTTTRLLMLLCIVLPVIIFKRTYEFAIVGWIIASFITLLLAGYLKYKPFQKARGISSFVTYKKIFNYSFPLMIATLGGVAIHASDQFYISRFFGRETFAEFSNGFIPLPFIPMITGAIHAVFVPLFSKLAEKENGNHEIALTWKRGVNTAVILLYPLLIYFLFFAKEVILLLFGPLYEKSYIYFRLAMISNFFMPYLFYSILLAKGKTKIYAKLHIVQSILIWPLGYFIIIYTNSAVWYVSLVVLLNIFFRQIGLFYAAKSISVSLLSLVDLKKIFSVVIPFTFVCYIIYWATTNYLNVTLHILIASGLSYFTIVLFLDNFLKIGIVNIGWSFVKKNTPFST
jgi:O-antigen/teichoic acid export membrane protein